MNRKEIAAKAIKSRWTPKATHQGVLKIMGKELPCVVLEDGRRIITQSSVFKAFERPQRGKKGSDSDLAYLPSFLQAKNLQAYVTDDIHDVIRPVQYFGINGVEATGFSAETIPTVCDIYLSALKEGNLASGQRQIAEISGLLVRSLSKVGIIGLVDEATGYQQVRPRDALEVYLNKVLTKELAAWCKKFPDEYYSNIYKIKNWPEFSSSKNKYSCVGHYTNDIIYSRLGKDVLDELKDRTPDTSKSKMHQWLSVDVGHPLLSKHMESILTLQKLAIAQGFGWKRFLEMVDLILPKKDHALPLSKDN